MGEKTKSIFKKIKSVGTGGLSPVASGKSNYQNKTHEQKAKARSQACLSCDEAVQEPIDFLQIQDERIVFLSKKMCDVCGCALPYLLRQDQKICEKW